MSNVRNMTEGNVRSTVLAFFFPIFFTNLLQQLYSFADTAIVGKGLGSGSLAAVGNMTSITFLVVGFSIGLANGFSVPIAQSFGAKDYKQLGHTLCASVKLSGMICVALTLLSIVGLRGILLLLRTDPSIMRESMIYGYIIFGGLVFTIAYNMCAAVLRALGDSKTPLRAIIVSSVLNIALDSLFIFVFRFGVAGAASATVFSQLISTVICFRRISTIELDAEGDEATAGEKDRRKSGAGSLLKKEYFTNPRSLYTNLLKNGIPMAFMNSVTAIGCMVVQYFVNGFGVACTAAYSACVKYNNLFMQPACTAGHTIASFAGQNSGAGRYDRVQKGLKVCLIIAFVAFAVLGSLMMFRPEWLASIILNDAEAIGYAVRFLPICGSMIWAVDALFVFRSALQGIGNPMIPMVSGILEMLLRIGVILIFSGTIGFIATAVAEIVAWTGALLMNMIAYHIRLQKKKRVFSKNSCIPTTYRV